MLVENSLLLDVEAYVSNYIAEQVPDKYAYHNIDHTLNVVEAVKEIGSKYELSAKEQEILSLAAWFHDTGYDKGPQDHESRGAKYAREFLSKHAYPAEDLEKVVECILVTKMPHQPVNLLQEIICDADLSHLGKKIYWDRCSKVRQELTLAKNVVMNEQEWVDFEMGFIVNHQYQTGVARQMYGKRKAKHIKQLKKQRLRLNPYEVMTVNEMAKRDKKKSSKKKGKIQKRSNKDEDLNLKQISLGRGVETMYRTTYRTHVNLSSIADNKANIMLSINAIIISITLSTLVPRFEDHPNLIIPTVILLFVCLFAIIFATLSTRPKITEGKFTREDIKNKRSNLLFFGNFYNMPLQDFHWGMTEMIKDNDFLYSSMTRDLYYLGVVLAKKYRYLRICYGIFMYGFIVAVIAFAISFFFN